LLDVVEVKNAIYSAESKHSVLGCGVTNTSTEFTFAWYKDGKEIDGDDRRVIAVHSDDEHAFSTVNFTKIGKMLHILLLLSSTTAIYYVLCHS